MEHISRSLSLDGEIGKKSELYEGTPKMLVCKNGDDLAVVHIARRYWSDPLKAKISPKYENWEKIAIDYDTELARDSWQLYCDGEFKKENIKVDYDWERCSMPAHLIRAKEKAKIDAEREAELEKPDDEIDLKKVYKLDMRFAKLRKMKRAELFQLGIDNINTENLDKPKAVEKLNQRIEEAKAFEKERIKSKEIKRWS